MYKKGMRRAAALLAVCWLGLLFRAAAETPAEKLEPSSRPSSSRSSKTGPTPPAPETL